MPLRSLSGIEHVALHGRVSRGRGGGGGGRRRGGGGRGRGGEGGRGGGGRDRVQRGLLYISNGCIMVLCFMRVLGTFDRGFRGRPERVCRLVPHAELERHACDIKQREDKRWAFPSRRICFRRDFAPGLLRLAVPNQRQYAIRILGAVQEAGALETFGFDDCNVQLYSHSETKSGFSDPFCLQEELPPPPLLLLAACCCCLLPLGPNFSGEALRAL